MLTVHTYVYICTRKLLSLVKGGAVEQNGFKH